METDRIKGLVRIGIVTDRNIASKTARVHYPDIDMTSGWLYCLQHGSLWVPDINDIVVCLYMPVENGDGFIIGGI